MTEQEKREKAVEEMAQIAYPAYNGISYIDYEALCRIVDADYRKADEVRKETIIKVAKWLNGRVNTDLIWFLLREFGVEVKE